MWSSTKILPKQDSDESGEHSEESSIGKLPDEMITNEVSYSLGNNDCLRLFRANRHFKRVLQPIVLQNECKALLDGIDCANDKMISEDIKKNPELMFVEIKYKEELISPLKLAFKNYDTNMWYLLYESIANNKDYEKCFLDQASEQRNIELTSLFNLYETFVGKTQEISQMRFRTKEALQELQGYWINLGKYIFFELPTHMLIELCCKMSSSSPEEYLPVYLDHDDKKRHAITLPILIEETKKKKEEELDFSLLAGQSYRNGSGETTRASMIMHSLEDNDNYRTYPELAALAKKNAEVLKKIFDKRKKQFENMKEELTKRLSAEQQQLRP